MGIEDRLPTIRKNVPLAPLTTFKIGGPARYFYLAKTEADLIKAVRIARENDWPFFILGGGSNLLIADEGFDGLIIKIKNLRQRRIRLWRKKLKIKNEEISAGAGMLLGEVVVNLIKAGLTGLEWAVGIPGTVGGAICVNAGAYGHQTSEIVETVRILDEKGMTRIIPVKDCRFGYRESIFKHRPWVILGARFRLEKGDRCESQKEVAGYLADRKRRIPLQPSVGSVFKNVAADDLEPVVQRMMPEERIKRGMLPAWLLIRECGLARKQIGGAKISGQHANIIVNLGEAKAVDVVALISLCKKKVKEKFGIELEEEIRYLGFGEKEQPL